ncbi:50S ribosomal protein L9 [bacterium]|nr:50S ribosomal protein L9 [bacterium]
MQVLLIRDLDRIGKAGDTKNVAEGFAKNYLFPRNIAVPATPGALKHLKLMKVSWGRQAEKEKHEFKLLAGKIEGLTLRVSKKAGEHGKLYGAVTTSELAELISKEIGSEIDKKQVLSDHIKD